MPYSFGKLQYHLFTKPRVTHSSHPAEWRIFRNAFARICVILPLVSLKVSAIRPFDLTTCLQRMLAVAGVVMGTFAEDRLQS
jgi:hypothetical protein